MTPCELDINRTRSWNNPLRAGVALIALTCLAALPSTAAAAGARQCPALGGLSARAITVAGVGCRTADGVIERAGSRRASFLCRAMNTASSHTVTCRRGRATIRYTTGDALVITRSTATPSGLSISATATADDPHDGVIVWATSAGCATDVPSAQSLANFGGAGGLIESEVGRGASGAFETPLARYEVLPVGTYSTTVNAVRSTITAGEFSTVCALLYDPVGESPYPGQPRRIPQDYVFASAQAQIVPGA